MRHVGLSRVRLFHGSAVKALALTILWRALTVQYGVNLQYDKNVNSTTAARRATIDTVSLRRTREFVPVQEGIVCSNSSSIT